MRDPEEVEVSVVMATYNGSAHVAEQLGSYGVII